MKNYDLVQDMMNKTRNVIEEMKPFNIIVAGKTGVGKSTLINSIFREKLAETGIGKPITKHLRKISKEGMPINIYDTKGLELERDVQKQVLEDITSEINKSFKKTAQDQIHVMWYCINSNSNRIEETEIEMINEFAKLLPVIVVLTQSIGDQAIEFRSYIDNMNLEIQGVQNILAETFKINEDIQIPASGLKELVTKTYDIIPEDIKNSFINAQQVDIERKARAARKWALGYITTSFGVGFTPIPFTDAAILVPNQIAMLAHITAIFGVPIDKAMITSIIASIGGTGGATFLGRYIVSNVIKMVPGVGTAVGGIISGTTASVITTALAISYIEVLVLISKGNEAGDKISYEKIEKLMKEKFKINIKLKKKSLNETEKQNEDISRQ